MNCQHTRAKVLDGGDTWCEDCGALRDNFSDTFVAPRKAITEEVPDLAPLFAASPGDTVHYYPKEVGRGPFAAHVVSVWNKDHLELDVLIPCSEVARALHVPGREVYDPNMEFRRRINAVPFSTTPKPGHWSFKP